MLWTEAPNMDDVNQCFITVGSLKAQIKRLKVTIDEKSIDVKKESPRKPYLVLEATLPEQKQLAELEAELDIQQAKLDFFNFHKEMFKVYGFVNR